MTSMLSIKKLIVFSLCVLLAAGAWAALVYSHGEKSAMVGITDSDPPWEVRTEGARSDPILISTVEDLQNMSHDLTADYALANDIDGTATREWNDGAGFEPVGKDWDNRFTGSLDGRNFTISGLYIDRSSKSYVGLFGCIGSGGSVSNLGMENVDITGDSRVGGLVGSNSGSVSDCYATGSVSGTSSVGGLVGNNWDSVSDCYATGSVSGNSLIGGLVGSNLGSVSDCYATGSVNGTGSYVGGLVGDNYGSVSNCYAKGNVDGGTEYVGGLVGYNEDGSVSNCYATGNVSGYGMVGGLVGENRDLVENSYATGSVSGDEHVGGLMGYNGGPVSDSYATGSVTGDLAVGGLVGVHFGLLCDSYATGSVTRSSGTDTWFGGFAGLNSRGKINNCYSTGSVYWQTPPHPTDKGFCGSVDTGGGYEMTGNFWDTEISGQSSSVAGTGKTTALMKTRSTFTDAGWDFQEVWEMIEHRTYPLLKWQDTVPPTANAGPDQTVNEGTIVSFDGGESRDNEGIVNYIWTFHDGTVNITLYGVGPTHAFPMPGKYVVTLTVTDMAGLTDTDTMTVTVLDITPPTAHAGPDQTVEEGVRVTLDGSASTDNVGIVNHTWTFHDGTDDITLHGSAPVHTFSHTGVFTITLKVTDTAGLTDTDTMTVTVSEDGSPSSIPAPRWHMGDRWTWLFTTMIEGQAFTYFFSEEIVGTNITSTDNSTILPEPCFKIEATFINEGKSTVVGYAWLSMETFQAHEQVVIDNSFFDEEDEDEDHSSVTILDYFLFGFMSVRQWPLDITTEGPYRWSDAGMVDVGERSYLCYRFNGTEGFSIYYSPEARHFVKALWEIAPPSDYIMYELMPDGAGTGGGNKGQGGDDSPLDSLFENLGPLPLIGYVGILVLTMLIAVAGTRRRKGRTEMNGTGTDPGVLMPESLPPPQVFQGSFSGTAEPAPMHPSASPGFPPWQTPQPAGPAPTQPPASSGFPPWQTSQSAGSSPIQPPASSAPSLLSTPPPSPDLHTPPSGFPSPPAPAPSPGVWFCPKCGKKLDTKYIFCLDCGFRRDG